MNTRGNSASRYTTGSSSYNNTYSSPQKKPFDPQLSIEPIFSPIMKNLENLLPNYKNTIKERILKEFNSYLRIDGRNSKSLFCVGFILIQDVISHSLIDWKDCQEFITDSFAKFDPYLAPTQSQKVQFVSFQKKIATLFQTATNYWAQSPTKLNDKTMAAKFIAEECKKDKDIVSAIIHAARCSIGLEMLRKRLNIEAPTIYNKLLSIGLEFDESYSGDIFKLFCIFFQYTVYVYTVSDTTISESMHGGGSGNQAHILDYYSRTKDIKMILYKVENFMNIINNPTNVSILTRNKNIDLDNLESSSKLNSSQTLKTESIPQPAIKEDVETCDLCGQEILKDLVFINSKCRHKYCYYCLQDLVDTHPSLKFCFLKKCSHSMSQIEIKQFRERCAQEEKKFTFKHSNSSLSGVPDEGPINEQPINITKSVTRNKAQEESKMNESVNRNQSKIFCSSCENEINESNPLVFVNKCGHSFCQKWFETNKPVYDGFCFNKKCHQSMDYADLKSAVFTSAKTLVSIKCTKCLKVVDFNKIFINPVCQHRLCISCTEKPLTSYCPVVTCREMLNENKLLEFKESIVREEDNKMLAQKVMICPSCSCEVTIYTPEESKLDYWKCPHCSKAACFKHNQDMSKCLCLCPKCLGSLSDASSSSRQCNKCKISYCMRCKKENKLRENCQCMEEEVKSKEPVTNKQEIVSKVQDPVTNGKPIMLNGSIKMKTYENVCNICNDFREAPEFLRLGCGHRMCEFCILVNRENFSKMKAIKCLICQK